MIGIKPENNHLSFVASIFPSMNLTEKWKLHAKRMELPGRALLFYIVPLIPNLIAGYSPASQRGYMKFEF